MMRRPCRPFNKDSGTECAPIDSREAIAEAVSETSPLAALLMASAIERSVDHRTDA